MKSVIKFLLLAIFLSPFLIFSQVTQFNYICPVPGSKYINPEQTLILKTGKAFDTGSLTAENIEITGTLTGRIGSDLMISSDAKTLIVKPKGKFSFGETVTVKVLPALRCIDGSKIESLTFEFHIKDQDTRDLWLEYYHSKMNDFNQASAVPNGNYPDNLVVENNLPPSFPPPVGVQYGTTNDQYIFITQNPRISQSQYRNYLTICDKYGTPIFFRKMDGAATNLMKLPDGTLAYARNLPTASEDEKFYLMDSSYVVIDSIWMGNGYNMDMHDLLLMENDHYLMMSYDPQTVDMSQIVPGGQPNATVVGLVIQEVDKNQNVYFQWRSWDHFQITDATWDINLTGFYIDYVHGNAFEFDADGDILLSSRHLDEITKIDYETGEVIWRFGLLCENNQFEIFSDPSGFSHQHDIRVLSNGNITLYDNGNLRSPQFSQALEYSLDEANLTATRVWNYEHDPTIYAEMTGSFRRSWDNKNLVGWGSNWPITATEVNMDGSKTFELYLPDTVVSYRALKYDWETNLFKTRDNLHFGNISYQTGPKEMIIPVTNNSNQQIQINSVYQHTDAFEVVSTLPLSVPAGGKVNMNILFDPESPGNYEDLITLNYDHYTLTVVERIARQVRLNGIWDESLPTVEFIPEYNSTNIDPGTVISILFSEPVRKANGTLITNQDIPTIFKFTKESENGPAVSFTGTITNNDFIYLYPDETLQENQSYFVKLIPFKLEDFDDNVIGYPEITMFTTGQLVSAGELTTGHAVRVFPSPFSETLHFTASIGIKKVILFSSEGKSVAGSEFGDLKEIDMSTTDLPTGFYFAEIHFSDSSVETIKLLKK